MRRIADVGVAEVVHGNAVRVGGHDDTAERSQLAGRRDTDDRQRRAVATGNVQVCELRIVRDDVDALAGDGRAESLAIVRNVKCGRLAFATTDEQKAALLAHDQNRWRSAASPEDRESCFCARGSVT